MRITNNINLYGKFRIYKYATGSWSTWILILLQVLHSSFCTTCFCSILAVVFLTRLFYVYAMF